MVALFATNLFSFLIMMYFEFWRVKLPSNEIKFLAIMYVFSVYTVNILGTSITFFSNDVYSNVFYTKRDFMTNIQK